MAVIQGKDLEWDKAVITWTRFRMGQGGYTLDKIYNGIRRLYQAKRGKG